MSHDERQVSVLTMDVLMTGTNVAGDQFATAVPGVVTTSDVNRTWCQCCFTVHIVVLDPTGVGTSDGVDLSDVEHAQHDARTVVIDHDHDYEVYLGCELDPLVSPVSKCLLIAQHAKVEFRRWIQDTFYVKIGIYFVSTFVKLNSKVEDSSETILRPEDFKSPAFNIHKL